MGKKITLFSKDAFKLRREHSFIPYDQFLQHVLNTESDASHNLNIEPSVFSDVVEYEAGCYRSHGGFFAKASITVEGRKLCDHKKYTEHSIPWWVEEDYFNVSSLKAKYILAVELGPAFFLLRDNIECFPNDIMLIRNSGIPRFHVRRFMQLMSKKFDLPVYLLTDCDTWGYFAYSILKRGVLAPHEEMKHFSIPQLKYLGIKANEIDSVTKSAPDAIRKGKANWKPRIEAMKEYKCFSTRKWQNELNRFLRNNRGIMLNELIQSYGPAAFIKDFITSKIERFDFL